AGLFVPMPEAFDANGLLPGRGPAGRGPGLGARPPPRCSPRCERPACGPGLGALGRGAPPRGGPFGPGWGTLGREAPPRAAGLGAGRGLGPGLGTGPGLGPGLGASAAGPGLVPGLGAAPPFLSSFFSPPLADPSLKDSFRRRTTGASIVEDAERTNSPI